MKITVSKCLSLSHCRTEGTTLEEPCLESTELDRSGTWRRSLWRATKVYIGPIILFLAYSFSGAALFHHLESQNELDALGKRLFELLTINTKLVMLSMLASKILTAVHRWLVGVTLQLGIFFTKIGQWSFTRMKIQWIQKTWQNHWKNNWSK